MQGTREVRPLTASYHSPLSYGSAPVDLMLNKFAGKALCCVCVCMCVCLRACMDVHVYMCVCACVCMYVCMYVRMYVCIFLQHFCHYVGVISYFTRASYRTASVV